MNAVLIKPEGTYNIEADENGKVLKIEKTELKIFKACPQCGHKNKPYNNYCTMCRWDLIKDKKYEDK